MYICNIMKNIKLHPIIGHKILKNIALGHIWIVFRDEITAMDYEGMSAKKLEKIKQMQSSDDDDDDDDDPLTKRLKKKGKKKAKKRKKYEKKKAKKTKRLAKQLKVGDHGSHKLRCIDLETYLTWCS